MSEEEFDVCTPEGVATGERASRSRAHREGLWHRSAHLWLTDGAGRVLLQQRHPGKRTDPGRWDIAVAGHVSAGQSPLEAVLREAWEELGLSLEPGDLTFLEARAQTYDDGDYHDREWQHLYATHWRGALEALSLQAEEVVAVRWMDYAEYRRRLAVDADYVDRRTDVPAFDAWLR